MTMNSKHNTEIIEKELKCHEMREWYSVFNIQIVKLKRKK